MVASSKNDASALTTLKVLIADDDTPTRMLLRAAISQWGYGVLEAKDGEEAWQCISQSSDAPRLLILDWLMPKIDGITLCGRSRKELSFQPYIILLTQVTGTTNLIKGLEAGADEFLSKPFNMAELRSRLSIGARIINNENKLAQQNKQLQEYINQMQTLLMSNSEITQNITIGLQQNASPPELLQQVKTVSANINTMLEAIKNLQSTTRRS